MSKNKAYKNGDLLNKDILEGVNELADNVASTMGPRGCNVLIHTANNEPIITKDGVTVAKHIEFSEPFKNAGAAVIKQAAATTNTNAGDGTTTATVLARAILNKAHKYISAGASPVEIKRGIDKAVVQVLTTLDSQSRQVESYQDICNIATISANGDEDIGKLISLAAEKAGKDGSITIEEARSLETTLEMIDGFRFDAGYVTPEFINVERRGAVRYNEANIFVTDFSITSVDEIMPLLEVAARDNKPLIIVADEIEKQPLSAMIINAVRGSMKVAAIKAPRYGSERKNIMSDLALATGGKFFSRARGDNIRTVTLKDLGSCKTIEVLKNSTTVVGGKGDWRKVENKIEALQQEIKNTDSLDECATIQERITRLASGVAVIYVGGTTQVEMTEKKHRIEDALEAIRAAQSEGIVPGGGLALLNASDFSIQANNEDQTLGASIVAAACQAPFRQMAINAGFSPDVLINKVLAKSKKKRLKEFQGCNFTNGEIMNLMEAGIIDPLKVTKTALINAASAASTLLTTKYAIVERETDS